MFRLTDSMAKCYVSPGARGNSTDDGKTHWIQGANSIDSKIVRLARARH